MSWHHAIWLGILQGVTEFLPVSSTAHLSLLEYYLGLSDTPRFFDVALHLGTLAAIVFFYRHSLAKLALGVIAPTPAEARLEVVDGTQPVATTSVDDLVPFARKFAFLVIVATLPAVTAGLVFRPSKAAPAFGSVETPSLRHRIGDWREHSSERPDLVAFFLCCTGVALFASSLMRSGEIGTRQFGLRHAVLIGIAQALAAICPGLSRSGATISTALLLGVEPALAVHFSLLMSVPAVLGAAVLKAKDIDLAWVTSANIGSTCLGVAVSAIVGWYCIQLLMRSAGSRRWRFFAVYVWSLALLVAVALAVG